VYWWWILTDNPDGSLSEELLEDRESLEEISDFEGEKKEEWLWVVSYVYLVKFFERQKKKITRFSRKFLESVWFYD
jgi:hypothetical protein